LQTVVYNVINGLVCLTQHPFTQMKQMVQTGYNHLHAEQRLTASSAIRTAPVTVLWRTCEIVGTDIN
jgi:hypothetical protein